MKAFSSLILGCKSAFYFPLKEVKAACPVAEVSEHTQSTLRHRDSDLKHAALFTCAGVNIPSSGERHSVMYDVVAVGT